MPKRESTDYGILRTLIDGIYARLGSGGSSFVTGAVAAAGGAGHALPSTTPTTILTANITVGAGGSIYATAHVGLSNADASATTVEVVLEINGVGVDGTSQSIATGGSENVTLTGKTSVIAAGTYPITIVVNAPISGITIQAGGSTGGSITAYATVS